MAPKRWVVPLQILELLLHDWVLVGLEFNGLSGPIAGTASPAWIHVGANVFHECLWSRWAAGIQTLQ